MLGIFSQKDGMGNLWGRVPSRDFMAYISYTVLWTVRPASEREAAASPLGPQGNILSHVSPQVGTESAHDSRGAAPGMSASKVFPHGQWVREAGERGQGPQLPKWHSSLQAWRPHKRARPQGSPQQNSRAATASRVHVASWLRLPQKHPAKGTGGGPGEQPHQGKEAVLISKWCD